MSDINDEAAANTDEHTSNNKNSGLGIAALVLSIPGCTILVGAILAIIDLFTNDGRKKICSTIAMCVCGLWLFTYIVGAILLIKYNDKADNVPQITQESEKLVGIPEEYQPVMENAVYYYDAMHLSKVGIYEQLTGGHDRFTEEQAQYALDHVEADWKENALIKAKEYQEYQHMSPDEIYAELTLNIWEYGDGFTEEEAYYAISNLE